MLLTKNKKLYKIISLTLLLAAAWLPAMSAIEAYAHQTPRGEYKKIDQLVRPDQSQHQVSSSAGTSIWPNQSLVYGLEEAEGRSAKSYIPKYLVDQYMRKNDTSAQTVRKTSTSYTIKKGDTLYKIAQFFSTSVDLIMLENHITDPTKLQIGQKLTIPSPDHEVTAWLSGDGNITDVFFATLTAYTAGYESTGKTPSHPEYGITASGAKVKENHTIAVDPSVIPLGTYVYIEGIGIRKAEDTGSAIKGRKIDVYIPELEEALEFGVKKNVKVYVLGTSSDHDIHLA